MLSAEVGLAVLLWPPEACFWRHDRGTPSACRGLPNVNSNHVYLSGLQGRGERGWSGVPPTPNIHRTVSRFLARDFALIWDEIHGLAGSVKAGYSETSPCWQGFGKRADRFRVRDLSSHARRSGHGRDACRSTSAQERQVFHDRPRLEHPGCRPSSPDSHSTRGSFNPRHPQTRANLGLSLTKWRHRLGGATKRSAIGTVSHRDGDG